MNNNKKNNPHEKINNILNALAPGPFWHAIAIEKLLQVLDMITEYNLPEKEFATVYERIDSVLDDLVDKLNSNKDKTSIAHLQYKLITSTLIMIYNNYANRAVNYSISIAKKICQLIPYLDMDEQLILSTNELQGMIGFNNIKELFNNNSAILAEGGVLGCFSAIRSFNQLSVQYENSMPWVYSVYMAYVIRNDFFYVTESSCIVQNYLKNSTPKYKAHHTRANLINMHFYNVPFRYWIDDLKRIYIRGMIYMSLAFVKKQIHKTNFTINIDNKRIIINNLNEFYNYIISIFNQIRCQSFDDLINLYMLHMYNGLEFYSINIENNVQALESYLEALTIYSNYNLGGYQVESNLWPELLKPNAFIDIVEYEKFTLDKKIKRPCYGGKLFHLLQNEFIVENDHQSLAILFLDADVKSYTAADFLRYLIFIKKILQKKPCQLFDYVLITKVCEIYLSRDYCFLNNILLRLMEEIHELILQNLCQKVLTPSELLYKELIMWFICTLDNSQMNAKSFYYLAVLNAKKITINMEKNLLHVLMEINRTYYPVEAYFQSGKDKKRINQGLSNTNLNDVMIQLQNQINDIINNEIKNIVECVLKILSIDVKLSLIIKHETSKAKVHFHQMARKHVCGLLQELYVNQLRSLFESKTGESFGAIDFLTISTLYDQFEMLRRKNEGHDFSFIMKELYKLFRLMDIDLYMLRNGQTRDQHAALFFLTIAQNMNLNSKHVFENCVLTIIDAEGELLGDLERTLYTVNFPYVELLSNELLHLATIYRQHDFYMNILQKKAINRFNNYSFGKERYTIYCLNIIKYSIYTIIPIELINQDERVKILHCLQEIIEYKRLQLVSINSNKTTSNNIKFNMYHEYLAYLNCILKLIISLNLIERCGKIYTRMLFLQIESSLTLSDAMMKYEKGSKVICSNSKDLKRVYCLLKNALDLNLQVSTSLEQPFGNLLIMVEEQLAKHQINNLFKSIFKKAGMEFTLLLTVSNEKNLILEVQSQCHFLNAILEHIKAILNISKKNTTNKFTLNNYKSYAIKPQSFFDEILNKIIMQFNFDKDKSEYQTCSTSLFQSSLVDEEYSYFINHLKDEIRSLALCMYQYRHGTSPFSGSFFTDSDSKRECILLMNKQLCELVLNLEKYRKYISKGQRILHDFIHDYSSRYNQEENIDVIHCKQRFNKFVKIYPLLMNAAEQLASEAKDCISLTLRI